MTAAGEAKMTLQDELRDAASWCEGTQARRVYSDADYIALFRKSADALDAREREIASLTRQRDEAVARAG